MENYLAVIHRMNEEMNRPFQALPCRNDRYRIRLPLEDQWVYANEDDIRVVGKWDGPSTFRHTGGGFTWQQYAQHQLGQVLRQRALVARLAEVGIDRFLPDPYLIIEQGLWRYDLRLNYDEIEKLLGPDDNPLR